jgi:hypothetical protein
MQQISICMSLMVGVVCKTRGEFTGLTQQEHGAAIACIADFEPYRCVKFGANPLQNAPDSASSLELLWDAYPDP